MSRTAGGVALPDPMVGRSIGHYSVRHKLAEGGMSSVYIAEHPAIGKRVALKVLRLELASQPELVSRFFTEARAVNEIQHPNIVDIVDFGVIASEIPGEPAVVYLLMEYIEGETLASLIRREAPLAPERAGAIALQIADALAASHVRGVLHRDLKPGNVMLTVRGRRGDAVKIVDFGLAKLLGSDNPGHRTQTGVLIGTPGYMSPEQCEARGAIDHRADVYALGIVLYEMLTGRVPFGGDGLGEILVQQVTAAPVAPSRLVPGIPEYLELVVLRALEKRPEDRFARMSDFALALQDPVTWVESHGGRAGFLSSPVRRDAPTAAHAAATIMLTLPAQGTPPPIGPPSPLDPPAGQLAAAAPGRRGMRVGLGLWIAAAIAIAGAGLGIAARSLAGSAPPSAAAAQPQP